MERLFWELKGRIRVAGVFPDEAGALDAVTAVSLGASEGWALKEI